MDANTLAEAMEWTRNDYDQWVDAFNLGMIMAQCTNVERAVMWCAQIGHESVGLKYMQELWGPTSDQRSYEGRRDLGNIYPGDGSRFRGHGPIQITGRLNHTKVSEWAHSCGLVDSPTKFVDDPDAMAGREFGFIGAAWYWTVARPNINAMCDRRDLIGVTKAINGGTNGLDDRQRRYNRLWGMGDRLLPSGGEDWSEVLTELRGR